MLETRTVLSGGGNIEGDWPTTAFSVSHANYRPGVIGTQLTSQVRWSQGINPNNRDSSGQAVTGGGLVYATILRTSTDFSGAQSSFVSLAAFAEETGNEIWHHDFDAASDLSDPSFDSGHVYIAASERIWAFDANTGIIEWTSEINRMNYFPMAISGGKIYVSGPMDLLCFDQATGKQIFSYEISKYKHYGYWAPSIEEGHVYSFVGGIFREHSLSNGAPIWSYEIPFSYQDNLNRSTVPAITAHKAYVISEANFSGTYLVGIDLVSHSLSWVKNGFYHGAPTIANGLVFASQGEITQAFDATNGTLKETYSYASGLSLITDDAIVLSGSTKTFILDRTTKKTRIILPVGGAVSLANSRLYVRSAGTISAFELNPKPFISVQIPSKAIEGQGALLRSGTVTISSIPTKDLIVSLESSAPSRLSVPRSVTILAHANSANFDLEVVDDSIVDLDVNVIVRVSAVGLSAKSDPIKVYDNDAEIGLTGSWTDNSDPSFTGYVPGKVGTHLTPELIWSKQIDAEGISSAEPGLGMLFVSVRLRDGSYLIAMDEKTGKEIWRRSFAPETYCSGPTYYGGRVFVTTNHANLNRALLAFDAMTGDALWTLPLSGIYYGLTMVVSPGEVPDTIYLSHHVEYKHDVLIGVSASTGERLFEYDPGSFSEPTASYYANHFYTWANSVFREHTANSGAVVRTLDLAIPNATGFAGIPAISNGMAFLTDIDEYSRVGAMIGVDLDTWKQSWRINAVVPNRLSVANGVIYSAEPGLIKGYDAKTGVRKIIFEAYAQYNYQPIVTDDALIISNKNGIEILDRTTGERIALIPVNGEISIANDTLFITTSSRKLVAYALHRRIILELPKEVSEQAGRLFSEGTITLDSAPDKDVVIKLSSSDSSRLKIPDSILIKANTTSAVFDIYIIDNTALDFNSSVIVTATLPNYFRASETVTILDNEPAILELQLPERIFEGSVAVGVVSSALAPTQDTIIELSSLNADRIGLPQYITLKANTKSVNFDLTAFDNQIEDGNKKVEIKASARNWKTAVASAILLDDEIPAFTVTAPSLLLENSGVVSGTLQIPYALDSDLRISLVSTLAGQVNVPASVIIRAGETKATFEIRVSDDLTVNGSRFVRIIVDAAGYLSTSHLTTLVDNEEPALSLQLPAAIVEGDNATAYGRVLLNFISILDVEFSLFASDTSRVSIPPKLIIPAGQQSLTFEVEVADNRRVDSIRSVTVSATAVGWQGASSVIRIEDDEVIGLVGEWETLGNGPEHSGQVPGFFGPTPQLLKAWNSPMGLINPIATGEQLLFVTPQSMNQSVYMVAKEQITGREKWRHLFDNAEWIGSPSYSNGNVYVQLNLFDGNSQLMSLSASTGAIIWVAPFMNRSARFLAPTVAAGVVYVGGGESGGLLAFDQSTGALLFFSELGSYEKWTSTVHDGKIYTWVGDTLREHSSQTGQSIKYVNLEWETHSRIVGTVPAIQGQSAYVLGGQGLTRIDLDSFSVIWNVPGEFEGIPAVWGDSVFAISRGILKAFDANTGTFLNDFATSEPAVGQALLTDDSVVVATSMKTYVFDRDSRKAIAILPVGGPISIANDMLWIAGEGGLSAFAINPVSPWQNASNNMDVDEDGSVSPIDVLLIINHINTYGSSNLDSLPTGTIAPGVYLDVDGDYHAGPLDLLVIINWINSSDSRGEGEMVDDGRSGVTLPIGRHTPDQNENQNVSLSPSDAFWSSYEDYFPNMGSRWRRGRPERI